MSGAEITFGSLHDTLSVSVSDGSTLDSHDSILLSFTY
jgi:hypothetical protein